MDKLTYAIGPNNIPVQYGGAARPVEGARLVSEEEALSTWSKIAVADQEAAAAVQAERDKVLAGAFASLTIGTKLTPEEAIALGARPLPALQK